MLNILDAIPVFVEDSLLYIEDNNNQRTIKIKKYQHYDVFKINKQTSYILSLCNSQNTLQKIIELLKNKYTEVGYETIKSDLLEVLERLWLLEVIRWKTDHPFLNYYGPKNEDYKLEALSSETAYKIFKHMNEDFIDEPYYDSKYMNKIKNIKDVIIVGSNSYHVIKKGEEIKLIYKIMNYSKPSKNSLLFHPVYMNNCDEISPTFLLECIKWSKNRHDLILKRKTNSRIYCNVDTHLEDKYKIDYLSEVGFKNIGEITRKDSKDNVKFNILALEV